MGKINNSWYTSTTDKWATPQPFFDELDKEFHFDLDPCAIPENAKCKRFFTPEDDGLRQNWGGQKCSAILHTEMLRSGSGKQARNQRSQTHWWLCLFQHGRTQGISTNISITRQRYDSSKGGCVLEIPSSQHHSRRWS